MRPTPSRSIASIDRVQKTSAVLKRTCACATTTGYWHWDPKFLDRRHPHDEEASREISEAASKIQIPTLLVRGGSSGVVGLENAQDLKRLVPC